MATVKETIKGIYDILGCNVFPDWQKTLLDALELIKSQDEHIRKLEDELYTITQQKANNE